MIAFLIIRYNDPWKFWWDVGVLILAVVICFMLPVEIAFEPVFGKTLGWKLFENILEVIFTIDLLMHFNTTFIDEDGNEIGSRMHISIDYVKEYHFWIDIASTISIKVTFKV